MLKVSSSCLCSHPPTLHGERGHNSRFSRAVETVPGCFASGKRIMQGLTCAKSCKEALSRIVWGTIPRFYKVFGPDTSICSHVGHVASFLSRWIRHSPPALSVERDGIDIETHCGGCIGGTNTLLARSNAFNTVEMNSTYLNTLAPPPSKSATHKCCDDL
jgi:hypothetical protein